MNLSLEALAEIARRPVDLRVASALMVSMERYAIATPPRAAMFLAQVAHESGGFRWRREMWGPTPTQLRYEERADLGNCEPGDGLRFCGRGFLQITGRANYRDVGRALGVDLEAQPELLETTDLAAASAGWWWAARKLNVIADADTEEAFRTVTRRINGGLNGWDDRLARWHVAREWLAPRAASAPRAA